MISPMLSSTLLFLALLATLSVIGALLVHKFVPRHARHTHRMLMQPALTVAGMMFSILLGFFIANALKDYTSANANLNDEANAIGEVFRDAAGLPDVDRRRIRRLCREYMDSVLYDEWPLISDGKTSDKAQAAMNELFSAALSVTPTNSREELIYHNFFRSMNDLAGLRRVRVATITNAGIPLYFWVIIAAGGAAIITLTFLFGPESKRFHAALIGCLIVPMALNIYLLAEYSHPLSPGMVVVKPVMFETVKVRILSQPDEPPHFLTDPQESEK